VTADLFLDDRQIASLTGIRRGRDGKTRHELRIDWLRRNGVTFWVSAMNRPVVPRSAIEGGPVQAPAAKAWVPDVLRGV
jgi:hypothetical protein